MRKVCKVDLSHPSLAGHFPDQPIVPAAVLIEKILEFLREELPDFKCCEMSKLKFVAPIYPEDEIQIDVHDAGEGFCSVKVKSNDQKCFSGRFYMQLKNNEL